MKLRKILGEYDRKLKRCYKSLKRQGENSSASLWFIDNFSSVHTGIKAAQGFISSKGENNLMPLFSLCKEFFSREEKVTGQRIISFFSSRRLSLFQCEALSYMLYAGCAAVICEGIEEKKESITVCAIKNLLSLGEIPFSDLYYDICAAERYLCDDFSGIYENMSEKTKSVYRFTVIKEAQKSAVSECEYIKKLLSMSESKNKHIGFFMPVRKNNRKKAVLFIASEWIAALLLSVFSAQLIMGSVLFSAVLLLLFYALIKPFSDRLSAKIFPPQTVLSMDKKTINECPVLVTVTCLIPSVKDSQKLYEHLSSIYKSLYIKGISVLLLCDLKSSDTPERQEDAKEIEAVKKVIERLNLKYSGGFSLIVRDRVFSPTENEFTGYERKRGAICSLVKLLNSGSRECSDTFYGDKSGFPFVKYIYALDSDSVPAFDSLRELLCVAEHPLNKAHYDIGKKRITRGYGIFSPLVSSSVASSVKSVFSSSYTVGTSAAYIENVSERNQDMFGQGVFSGKGLIDVEAFDLAAGDIFDKGRILSHDILEGDVLRTLFCPRAVLEENFPSSPESWFRRLHRWIRGDVQNLKYVLFPLGKEKLSPSMSRVGRWLLIDNFRRAVTPVICLEAVIASCFLPYRMSVFLLLLSLFSFVCADVFAVICVILRYGINSFYIKKYPSTLTPFYRAAAGSFFGISSLPTAALYSLDAITKAMWRSLISKKKLLSWCTFSDSEKMKKHSILFSVLFPFFSAFPLCFFGTAFHKIAAVMFLLFIPFSLADGIEIKRKDYGLSGAQRQFLKKQAFLMWQFFSENVTDEVNFLPPDNISGEDCERTAAYTSPTNIGLYLTSIMGARDMGFIEKDEMNDRIEKTLDTIDRLPKYKGHLFNWYNIRNTDKAAPSFVSFVDCGNYLTCLTALKEGLYEYGDEKSLKNAKRLEIILYNSDLSVFYDKVRELFSIGIDADTEEKHPSYYECYMSEARMGSFLAVARRQVPADHWKMLSRIKKVSIDGERIMSWTGTMFEYFMPRLFHDAPVASLYYEGLQGCLRLQKKRARRDTIPYGISESAYYEFDEMQGFMYKAHGVKELALNKNADTDSVISPYSAFLTLTLSPRSAIENLLRLEKAGASGKYGFYEAVDFSEKRRGGSDYHIVKSYMSHHVGMSFISVANVLNSNNFVRRFMSDEFTSSFRE